MSIKLPPLQGFEQYAGQHEELRARDLEVARLVLEAAAQYLNNVHATRLHKFADAIRALEFKHAE